MPVYDFACHACGHTWEDWDNKGEAGKRDSYGCPRCRTMFAARLSGNAHEAQWKCSGKTPNATRVRRKPEGW